MSFHPHDGIAPVDDIFSLELGNPVSSPVPNIIALKIPVNHRPFATRIKTALQNALGTTVAVTLDTARFTVNISVGMAMHGDAAAGSFMALVQAIGFVPFISLLYACSAKMSIQEGEQSSNDKSKNSLYRAASKLALLVNIPQAIVLGAFIPLSSQFHTTHTSAVRNFLIAYLPGIPAATMIIAKQERFMANGDILGLVLHNALYASLTIASFFATYEIGPGWSVGLGFSVGSILTLLSGDYFWHNKYPNSYLFNTYAFYRPEVKRYLKDIWLTGRRVALQYGFANAAPLGFLLVNTLGNAEAQANALLILAFNFLVVIPLQIIQATFSEFIGNPHGEIVGWVATKLKEDKTTEFDDCDVISARQTDFALMFLTNLIVPAAEAIAFAYYTDDLARIFIPEDSPDFDRTIELIQDNIFWSICAGACVTLTEILNAYTRKTEQDKDFHGWVQSAITVAFTGITSVLAYLDVIDFETSWILFAIPAVLKLIFQAVTVSRTHIDYKDVAQQRNKPAREDKPSEILRINSTVDMLAHDVLQQDMEALEEEDDFEDEDAKAGPTLSTSAVVLEQKRKEAEAESKPKQEAEESDEGMHMAICTIC